MKSNSIDFILRHFEGQPYLFPRRIATRITEGAQFPVTSVKDILDAAERAHYMDVRINAYPFDPEGKIAPQQPSIIFAEIDDPDPTVLNKVLRRMKQELIISYPTVITSGGDHHYHIIQPMDASTFHNTPIPDFFKKGQQYGLFKERETEFIRFNEQYLSRNKSDARHSPSINSCLLRFPESINSKHNKEVQIIQEWDERKPSTELIAGTFYAAKLQEYNEFCEEQERKRVQMKKAASRFKLLPRWPNTTRNYAYDYVFCILETPLADFRQFIMSLVIVPYLLRIEQRTPEEAYQITIEWLTECSRLQPLSFDFSTIWDKINYVITNNYKPMWESHLFERMKSECPEMYRLLQARLSQYRTNTKTVAREVRK